MTSREQAACAVSIEAMRRTAIIAAVTIGTRDDAPEIRHQAAGVLLLGLAGGKQVLKLGAAPAASTHEAGP